MKERKGVGLGRANIQHDISFADSLEKERKGFGGDKSILPGNPICSRNPKSRSYTL